MKDRKFAVLLVRLLNMIPACNARERMLGKDEQWKRRNKGRPVYLELESTGVGGFYLKHQRRETVDLANFDLLNSSD